MYPRLFKISSSCFALLILARVRLVALNQTLRSLVSFLNLLFLEFTVNGCSSLGSLTRSKIEIKLFRGVQIVLYELLIYPIRNGSVLGLSPIKRESPVGVRPFLTGKVKKRMECGAKTSPS